ncbi:MAG: acyl carrier protein [Desulfobacterales bacterium]|nr:acyl carrier protein [Desulfobacterales bacterium]
MEQDQLFSEIKKIVAYVIEVDENEFDGETKFVDDLGVDSMMALEILVGIEKKYKVKIPEDRLENITNLNESVALAREFIEGK